MNATTGNEANDNTENVDWAALAPEGGERIPELLEQVAASDSALSDLHDIIQFPAPGHRAAPKTVDRLVDVAVAQETPAADRWRPLSLLLELVSAHAEDRFPQDRDLAQWRDEVAWATSTDAEKVREQYRTWMEEAPDEQHYHRMRNRLLVMESDEGAEILQAELDTYEAVLARVPDLVTLLHGGANRAGLDRAGEWVSYLLGFLPAEAERICGEITAASQVLLAKDLRPAPKPPTTLAAMQEAARQGAAGSGDPLPAELFAPGLLADPWDVDTTVGLTHQMAGGNLYNSFAAAVALVLIHGKNTPREGLRRVGRGGGTSTGYQGLFDEAWPHCGNRSPQVLGFLALGRAGERARRLRLDILPGLIKSDEESRALVTGVGLEIVLGPRTKGHTAEEHAQADYEEETLRLLWAIAELPASAWEDEEFTETLRAWALPDNAEEFRALVGADAEPEVEEDADAAAEASHQAQEQVRAQQSPQQAPTGFLGRLFGGGR